MAVSRSHWLHVEAICSIFSNVFFQLSGLFLVVRQFFAVIVEAFHFAFELLQQLAPAFEEHIALWINAVDGTWDKLLCMAIK